MDTDEKETDKDADKVQDEAIVQPDKEYLHVGYGHAVEYVKRVKWGAKRRVKLSVPLLKPATMVRLTTTGFHRCGGNESCASTVKNLQTFYMDSGMDIPHNFMIGGDNVVYEGRGFSMQPVLPNEYADLAKQCIDIAFVGTYEYESPPYSMMRLAIDIMKGCIKRKLLDPKFEIIPLPELQRK